jgi:hypothetical protein
MEAKSSELQTERKPPHRLAAYSRRRYVVGVHTLLSRHIMQGAQYI